MRVQRRLIATLAWILLTGCGGNGRSPYEGDPCGPGDTRVCEGDGSKILRCAHDAGASWALEEECNRFQLCQRRDFDAGNYRPECGQRL